MTLIIAMIMLVIIGFTSVAVMRNTLSTDQVAVGTRSQAQALQYAQAALRWCEMRWQAAAPTPALLDATTPPHWAVLSNWRGPSAVAYTLSRADLAATGPGIAFPAHAPQCLSELRAVDGGTVTVTTARGASLDFSDDARGHTRSGAVVWVQSTAAAASGPRAWRQLLTPPSP